MTVLSIEHPLFRDDFKKLVQLIEIKESQFRLNSENGVDRLEILKKSNDLLVECEQIGEGVESELRKQTEKLQGGRAKLSTINGKIINAAGLVSYFRRTQLTQKFFLKVVFVISIILVVLILVVKLYK